jgi:acyl-CoA thioesterase
MLSFEQISNNIDKTSIAFRVFWEMYQNDRVSKWLGMQPIIIEEGHNIFEVKIKNDFLNGFDIVHGGILVSIADSSFAFATNSYGIKSVTLNLNINYNSVAKENELLYCETQVKNITNKIIDADVELYRLIENKKQIITKLRGQAYKTHQNFVFI